MNYLTKHLYLLLLIPLLAQNTFAQSPSKAKSFQQEHYIRKIVGGKTTQIEEVPWQVFLREDNSLSDYSAQFCGGSIIDKYWVLTAAHCVEQYETDPTKLRVVAGKTSLYSEEGQRMKVTEVIIHPGYTHAPHISNDIALLRLRKPLDLSTDKIQSIEMITMEDQDAGLIDSDTEAMISGWGNLSGNSYNFPDSLQSATLSIISNEVANGPDSYDGLLDEGMMAAGNLEHGGKDACQGDSGGPLVVRNEDDSDWLLAGITSWGYGCGQPHLPGVYARVSVFEEWVQEVTQLSLHQSLPFEADLAIARLISFGTHGKPSYCKGKNTTGELKMVIENKGLISVNAVKINIYAVWDQQEHLLHESHLSFEEELNNGDSEFIALTDFHFNHLNNYDLKVEIGFKDGRTDNDSTNNYATHSVNLLHGYTSKVNFAFDERPNEVTWQVVEAHSREIVFTGNGGEHYSQNLAGTSLSEEFCLPEGQYILVVHDLFNNGLSHPNGYVELFLPVADSLRSAMKIKGNYGGNLEFPFTLPFVPEEKVEIGTFLDLMYSEEDNIEMPLRLYNRGNTTIQELEISWQLAGIVQKEQLDKAVLPANFSDFAISLHGATHEQNNIKIWINSINGKNVDVLDTISITSHKPVNGIEISANLFTDSYPEESSWKLLNEDGKIIAGQNTNFHSNDTIEQKLNLPEGKYTLVLHDQYGDGSNAPIAFAIKSLSGDPIIEIKGDEFEAQHQKQFYLVNAPSDILLESLSPTSTRISWIDNSKLDPQFKVNIYNDDEQLIEQLTTGNGTNYVEIADLVSNHSYAISVTATKYGFNSLTTEIQNVITAIEDDPNFKELTVYPNPTSDLLKIEWENVFSKPLEVSLFDFSGRNVLSQNTIDTQESTILDLSEIPVGIYFVKTAFSDNVVITQKVVVQK